MKYFPLKYLTMAAFSHLMLLIWIVAFCLKILNIVNGKLCHTTIRKSNTDRHHSIYNKVYFCCDNTERVNGGCRDCRTGFLSAKGEPCMPCISNRFGRRCSEFCTCEKYESCHNVFGCISVSTMKDQTDKSVTTSQNGTYTDGIEDKLNNVLLYTVCTGSLALIMILASSTLTYYRREKSKGNYSHNDIQSGNNKGRTAIIIV